MERGPKIAHVAFLVGEPTRANMLASLIDGRALTASELAYVSGVSPQTTSGHLAKLSEAGLLACEKQGRHRYFRLASPLVSRMLESLMVVAETGPARRSLPLRGGDALRTARTCYDHLAGRLAVALADSLVERSFVVLTEDGGELTESGRTFLAGAGIDVAPRGRRVFCRPCLDWSERRPHLAGVIGAALLRHAFDRRWVERIDGSRALAVTAAGGLGFSETFGVSAEAR